MVAKGNVDKHRHSMSGLKVEEFEKWGRAKAEERYGRFPTPNMKAEDRSEPQKLGDRNNLRGPSWKDDHANDWVRGAGENATNRPGYVPGFKGKR
jgi:hypothetical protein